MSDLELILASLGLLFAAFGIVAWFYVRRVKQAHRHIMRRFENPGRDDAPASPQGAMPSFKFPNYLKTLIIAMLLTSAVLLVWAIVRLVFTLLKVALIVVAVLLLVYLFLFLWRRLGGKLADRRPKIWYEDD